MKLKVIGLSGNQKVLNRMATQTIRYKKGVVEGFYQSARSLDRQIKHDLNDQASKQGRYYRIRGRRHRASAPEQTAATITGHYERSVYTKVNGSDQMVFGADAHYAGYLEKGTVKMLPRPSLLNTIKKDEKNTYRYLRDSVFKWVTK